MVQKPMVDRAQELASDEEIIRTLKLEPLLHSTIINIIRTVRQKARGEALEESFLAAWDDVIIALESEVKHTTPEGEQKARSILQSAKWSRDVYAEDRKRIHRRIQELKSK